MSGDEDNQLEQIADGKLGYGYGADDVATRCPNPKNSTDPASRIANCTFGDRTSTRTMVLVGDSRAEMWFDVLDKIATSSGWKLIVLAEAGCPAATGTVRVVVSQGGQNGVSPPGCTAWNAALPAAISSVNPQVVVDSSAPNLYLSGFSGSGYQAFASAAATETAVSGFLTKLPSGAKKVMLGGYPNPYPSPVNCLAKNPSKVQDCAYTPNPDQLKLNTAAQEAAQATGTQFIDQLPWLCATKCPAVIGSLLPYTEDGYHIQYKYAAYLTGVLWASLQPDLQ